MSWVEAIQQLRADVSEARLRCKENTIRWLGDDEEPPEPSWVEVFATAIAIRMAREDDNLRLR